jgi:hypothetical protein
MLQVQVNAVKHLGSRARSFVEHGMLRLRARHDTFAVSARS